MSSQPPPQPPKAPEPGTINVPIEYNLAQFAAYFKKPDAYKAAPRPLRPASPPPDPNKLLGEPDSDFEKSSSSSSSSRDAEREKDPIQSMLAHIEKQKKMNERHKKPAATSKKTSATPKKSATSAVRKPSASKGKKRAASKPAAGQAERAKKTPKTGANAAAGPSKSPIAAHRAGPGNMKETPIDLTFADDDGDDVDEDDVDDNERNNSLPEPLKTPQLPLENEVSDQAQAESSFIKEEVEHPSSPMNLINRTGPSTSKAVPIRVSETPDLPVVKKETPEGSVTAELEELREDMERMKIRTAGLQDELEFKEQEHIIELIVARNAAETAGVELEKLRQDASQKIASLEHLLRLRDIEMEDEREQVGKMLTSVNQERDSLHQQVIEKSDNLKTLRNDHFTLRQSSLLKDELITEMQSQIRDLKAEAASLQTENKQLEADLNQVNVDNESLLEQVNDSSTLTADLARANKTVEEISAGNMAITKQLNDALESIRVKDEQLEQRGLFIASLSGAPRDHASPQPSPTPFTSHLSSASAPLTSEALRVENVRKTYITVKKKYDNLHSISRNILECARSMHLANWGEFGANIRKLKDIVDDTGAGQTD
ncbi:hypothetical protein B0J11DRAFT_500288 [Dendryphion nanum]|uniref:Uncharacterized protein n=1 Tax=Dendryphion nanum TaxID=256645 RepID=A0A9P9EJQ9_9PLEO|nr:hypothetical protein B0J11DRAFT_500288 [Dendryphion nanum]